MKMVFLIKTPTGSHVETVAEIVKNYVIKRNKKTMITNRHNALIASVLSSV